MIVTRFTMFTDTEHPVFLPLKELELKHIAGYTDIPWLHSIEGLGDISGTVLTNQTTLGSYSIGRSTPSRTLTVHLIFPPGWSPQTFRQQLYDDWNLDLYDRHTYRLEFGDHQYRERYIDGIIESITSDIFSNVPMMHISIVCPNPNYYFNPYGKILINNGVKSTDNSGEMLPRMCPFQTMVETGMFISITPGGAGLEYDNVKISCTTEQRGTQSFQWNNHLLANAPFGPKIKSCDIIFIDTTPGELHISLTRGGQTYNLLPWTTMTNGVMRVLPNTNVYRMQLFPLNSPYLTGYVTCKELYMGV